MSDAGIAELDKLADEAGRRADRSKAARALIAEALTRPTVRAAALDRLKADTL